MRYVAGIDGGQSSTRAVIGDAHGRIVAYGRAGPADEVGEGPGSTRLRRALHDALADTVRAAGLPPEQRFEAIVGGISGYDGVIRGVPPSLPSDRVVLLHDAPVAHAGAFAGGAGVVVIAGTGSVVYGRNEMGRTSTLGGWGYLFGDEGSAFWLVREALAQMMRACDDDEHELDEAIAAAQAFFAVPSLHALARAFYAGAIGRDRLAAFAGDVACMVPFAPLVARGAARLARLAHHTIATLAMPRESNVVALGGVFAGAAMREAFNVAVALGGARIVAPHHDAVVGALVLAYREAGISVSQVRAS